MTATTISLRSRSADGEPLTVIRRDWNNAKLAVVICDMWDTTNCISAAQHVVDMAPRVNEVACGLGALITDALCVIDREAGAGEALRSTGVTLHSLFRKHELEEPAQPE